MSVNKQKLLKTGIWQLMNTAVIILSQIIANAVIVRYVSPEQYGIMAIANAFINFASFISEAGMGDALMQRKIVEPQHKNAALYFSILVSVVLYGILYISAPWIASFYSDTLKENAPALIPSLRVLGLSFIFLALGSSSLNLMMKNFNFKRVFFSDSLSLFISNILGIVLAIYGYGIWSLVYSILFYNVARLIMVWIYEPIPIFIGASLRHWKDLFNYGVGLTLVRFYNYVSGFGIMLQIGKLVDDATLGFFERSYRITNIPVRYLGDMIQKIMMPFMVKINDEEEKLFAFFYRGMSFANAMLVPISVFAIVFCHPIVLILLGPKWQSAVLPMQLLFLSLPFRITTKVADVLMRAKNLVFKNANRKLQYIIVLCAGIFIGNYFWGVNGISLSVTIAAVFNYVFMLITIKKHVFQKGWQKLIIKPFKNGVILALITVAPSYLIYIGLMQFLDNKIIAFSILCSVLAVFFGFAFFKKPAILGKDFVQLRQELLSMAKGGKKGGGKGKRRKNMQAETEAENNIEPITD